MQAIIRRPRAEALNDLRLREYQRYYGWTLKILTELEHSGGMTTREISDRVNLTRARATNKLCQMRAAGLIEKIDNWGWRITHDGLNTLFINVTTTTQQQHNNNPSTTLQLEKQETAPYCFNLKTCHIKRLTQDKTYSLKNRVICHGPASCIWNARIVPVVPADEKATVLEGSQGLSEAVHEARL